MSLMLSFSLFRDKAYRPVLVLRQGGFLPHQWNHEMVGQWNRGAEGGAEFVYSADIRFGLFSEVRKGGRDVGKAISDRCDHSQ
jgi:hypothetical protein